MSGNDIQIIKKIKDWKWNQTEIWKHLFKQSFHLSSDIENINFNNRLEWKQILKCQNFLSNEDGKFQGVGTFVRGKPRFGLVNFFVIPVLIMDNRKWKYYWVWFTEVALKRCCRKPVWWLFMTRCSSSLVFIHQTLEWGMAVFDHILSLNQVSVDNVERPWLSRLPYSLIGNGLAS